MGQLKCKKVKLWHCSHCRQTLACISSENSTNHEECWLILTGLPSLLLDPISCRLVSSAVRCRLPTAPSPSPVAKCFSELLLPTPSSGFLLSTPDGRSLPTSSRVEISGPNPLSGFAPKQTKGSFAWRTTYIVSQWTISKGAINRLFSSIMISWECITVILSFCKHYIISTWFCLHLLFFELFSN